MYELFEDEVSLYQNNKDGSSKEEYKKYKKKKRRENSKDKKKNWKFNLKILTRHRNSIELTQWFETCRDARKVSQRHLSVPRCRLLSRREYTVVAPPKAGSVSENRCTKRKLRPTYFAFAQPCDVYVRQPISVKDATQSDNEETRWIEKKGKRRNESATLTASFAPVQNSFAIASIKVLRSATFVPFTTIEWDFFLCDHASHTRRLEGRFFLISYKGSNRLGPKEKSSRFLLTI